MTMINKLMSSVVFSAPSETGSAVPTGKRTVEQVKEEAITTLEEDRGDIKRISELVNFNLTREQVAFCIAATDDDMIDANWRTLLSEMYTGDEQSVVDMAYEMTGNDLTPEQEKAVRPFLDHFKETRGRYPNLSMNKVYDVLSKADSDAGMEKWLSSIEEVEPEGSDELTEGAELPLSAINIEEIKNVEQSAYAIADELAKDTELQSLLSKTADTSQFLKIAPVLLMQRIEEHFPEDAMEGWPVPGSRHPKGIPSEGNIRFDRYQTIQGTKKKMVSFYGNIFNRFPEGASINRELAEIERGDDGRYAVSPSTGWTVAKRNAEAKTLQKRYKDQVTYFGNAVRLHQQLAWLKQYPGCEVEFDTDVDGSLRRTTTPFILTPKTGNKLEVKYASPMTIGDVLRLDREKAMTGMAGKTGGTWEALQETKKRIKSPEQVKADLEAAKKLVDAAIKDGTLTSSGQIAPSPQATEVGLIKNVGQAGSYIGMLAHFAKDLNEEYEKKDSKLVKEWVNEMGTNDDLILSLWDLIKLTDSVRGRVETRLAGIEGKKLRDSDTIGKAKVS